MHPEFCQSFSLFPFSHFHHVLWLVCIVIIQKNIGTKNSWIHSFHSFFYIPVVSCDISPVIIHVCQEMYPDCDCSISVQLISKRSAKICDNRRTNQI